ncbi:glycosyltransferase family 4 protein [[Clostridium] innocuum]|nr:glycosyltransferase family 4 protein [[Clostridium] innocuum]
MIKIAFVSPGKLPQPAVKGGAVEGLIDLLVESLVERYDKYDVHVYSIGENDEDKIISGVKYHYIKNHGFSNQIARKTRGIINALSKNIYVGNNYIDNVANRIHNEKCLFDFIVVQNVPEYGLVLKKCNAKKYILHMHNNGFNKNSKCARKIFDLYDEIYTISGTVRNYVCSICESEKVKILYNGVDYSIFGRRITKTERQSKRESLHFKYNDTVYVFAGRLTKEKGVRELIVAFKQLVQKKANTKLMIIGSSFFDGAKDTEYVSELKSWQDPLKIKSFLRVL